MVSESCDEILRSAVLRWREHFLQKLDALGNDRSTATNLLKNKNLAMYWALGCVTSAELARQIVSDHIGQTIEQTAGWLYESILQEAGMQLGIIKVENKKSDGHLGLDFIQISHGERRLIDLASGSNTKNGGARKKSILDMTDNEEFWERQYNDNPLSAQPTKIVKVWAMARGKSKEKYNNNGILEVRGEAMWAYFGLGEGFTDKLTSELGKQHVGAEELNRPKDLCENTIRDYLWSNGFSDAVTGEIDYQSLVTRHP